MKKKYNVFRFFVALLFTLSISFFHAQDISDAEFADLLKDIEKMVSEMEQEQKPVPEFPAIKEEKIAPTPKAFQKTVPEKKIERKDPRSNFLESFQPAKPQVQPGAPKEEVVLPDFKREALEAYFSAFLVNLLDVRKKAASVDVYRRTKTFAPYIDQLNELETIMWEIVSTPAYHIPFYSSQFNTLRSKILQIGKELERSNRALKMPETEEVVITTREEFERLRPEKAIEKFELKKLTKLFSHQLKPLVTEFKKVISAAGKDIEEIKKKYAAEERTAERHRKDLESRAARYRPSAYSGPSFWESPTRYVGEMDNASVPSIPDFGLGVPGLPGAEMFPFGENDQALFPAEKEYETGLPEEKDQERIETAEKEQFRDLREKAEKSNFERERELKEGIISLVDQAQQAIGDDEPSEEQKTNVRESFEAIKQYISELTFVQASLHENRKKNKAWSELENRYQKALQTFKKISKKAGISEKETDNIFRQSKAARQQFEEMSKKLDEKQQKAIDELKKDEILKRLKFVAKTILTRNTKDGKNIFHLNRNEAETLRQLSVLDKKKSDPNHMNRVLAKTTNILPHMRAMRDVLSQRKQRSLKLEDLIEKVEAIEDAVREQFQKS